MYRDQADEAIREVTVHLASSTAAEEQSPDMTEPSGDTLFAGSIPDMYERLMVPLIFEPYALDDLLG